MEDILIRYNEKMSFFAETRNIFQADFPNFKNKKFFQKDLAKTLKIISLKVKMDFMKGGTRK